ncbi:MAG: site-specific DNA-methyltransferase [Gammaproteobacteria bacterium CG11_big_fil_rev_8_21_14_0_20_46_22]|nr:MAG: site-specific DNA-methyltransferase [Gammaproteobacteria bacterium CG12_big_fil_rev_8_21_14_0_65_46_12]PIR11770.1 MAG: site-specific DNA-methyltransferase [Gammaproteobacteria bacterium CG11_big_fil_rev_8_21_14_0_20_46_22]
MEKMKMHSPNLTQENIARIREMFPGCVTEAQSEDGKLRFAVDFDQLRQELSESIVEGPQERYHLNWPGKRESLLTANAPIAKTLRPCREESVDFDTTKNLFIEGDNLEALKLLQETYLGKVKLIYIDPPYNTGSDFIYDDDFAESSEEFLRKSNQKDVAGNRLVTNTEANGRFHSDWLSLMYGRLKLVRNILAEDGVMFISIDDGEAANLLKLCDEVFGEKNFMANIIWQKRTSPDMRTAISQAHEYFLVYAKNSDYAKSTFKKLPLSDEQKSNYKNPDNDPRGPWVSSDFTAQGFRPNQMYKIITSGGAEYSPPEGRCWKNVEEVFKQQVAEGRFWFGADGKGVPRRKTYLSETEGYVPWTWWTNKEVGHSQQAKKEVNSLFGKAEVFSTPKPVAALKRMLQIASDSDSIVLDFFAGSSSTAHAVMELNAEDGGNRKFIMVQLPEPCDEKSEAFKAGYKTIAEISKERIRRAGKKTLKDECHEGWNKDIGFRVLKIDSSNMADVYYTPDFIEQGQLKIFTDNIKLDRKPEDLLFQVLLDWGVDLSLPIRKETIQGKTVFFVDENALVACFDTGVNEDLVKELAGFEPLRVVFRDSGFVSDAVKINVEQIFKQMSPGTDVKSI